MAFSPGACSFSERASRLRPAAAGKATLSTWRTEACRDARHLRIALPRGSGGSAMSCMVRNISAEGAAIDVENPAFVPSRFRLVMANNSRIHECRVAWTQRNRIGLSFVDNGIAGSDSF
jgi:hypothetical protein